MYVWLVFAFVVLIIWAWTSTKRPSWCPPGPPLLPWAGNLFAIDFKKPHQSYVRWAADYGRIYHLKLGAIDQVILNDPDLIREAFAKPEVTGRPNTALFRFLVRGRGLGSTSGELWQHTRRMTLHHLRNLGMGKSKLEEYMLRQVTTFMDEILIPGCGRELELDHSFNVAVLNIIWNLVASEELSLSDTKIIDFITKIMDIIKSFSSLVVLDAAPWLTKILPNFVFNMSKVQQESDKLFDSVFGEAMRRHKEQLDVNDENRDYLDAILKEQRKRPDLFTDFHIMMSLVDLFFAGNDTTATSMHWALCFLCCRPECQRKLQEELDEQVGRHRPPLPSDRQKLPYTEAVIMETQRLADIVPLFVPHITLAPVSIGGYRIPAGVQIIGNAHSVHHNKELFPDPLEFKPERFLDAQGQFKPNRNVMPFSVGKRQCLGESLARAELFIFLTSFVQNFSFSFPEGFRHDFSDVYRPNFVRDPTPYKLIPRKR